MSNIEEAIERLEKRIKDNEDYKTTQVWLTDDVSAVYTVLNMIKDLQRKNKTLTQTNRSYKGMIRKKDSQIDLMAELIARKAGSRIEICHNMQCDKKVAKECKVCTKQYFERKANNGN